jgi:hypothetical protein
MTGMIEDCIKREADKIDIELQLEKAVKQIIFSTTVELLGDIEDPEDTLERFIQENGLDRKDKRTSC